MNLLINNAYAAAEAPSKGGNLSFNILLVIFGILFYFLLYRPQSKRTKEHKKLMDSISKGCEVLTDSGFMGQVSHVSENANYLLLMLNDNLEVAIKKESITAILPKGTLKALCSHSS